jgi:hypothetical protein
VTFYDAVVAKWSAATFEPEMVVYYVERKRRDWRWLWLRKRLVGEVVHVSHYPKIKVKLATTDSK